MRRAVRGEPVKLRRARPGCAARAAPASSPVPCRTLSTPAGRPASAATSASIEQVSGAHSGGLSTTVLPAARAGPTFHVLSISGAFQGVISAATPGGLVADVVVHRVAGDDLASHPARKLGEERDVVCASRHHVLPVADEQGAVVAGLDGRELVDAGEDAIRQPVEDGPASGRPQRGPARKRLARRPHRILRFPIGAGAHFRQRLAVDGREHGEAPGRCDPFPADPVPGVDADAGDSDAVRHVRLKSVSKESRCSQSAGTCSHSRSLRAAMWARV